MIKVVLSKSAAEFIRKEAEYLRQRNYAAAQSFGTSIKDARRLLQSFPQAGNRMHGLQLPHGLTLVSGAYLLDYVYDGRRVEIVFIRHERMSIGLVDSDARGDDELP